MSLGGSEQTKCVQSSQAKAHEVLYCTVTLFQQQSHHMSSCPHSCLCPALFLLPRTSHRATSPPCFRPRRKVQLFQGPQTAWFRRPFLFSWSFRACFSFSAASVQWFCPQNGHKHEGITLLHTLGNQQPAAARNRNLPSHTTISTNTSTKENKQ